MTLHEELKGIDRESLIASGKDVVIRQFTIPDEADATEEVLKEQYPGLYSMIPIVRVFTETMGLSEREAHLVAGGMVLQLALLKNEAEKQLVEQVDLH